MLFLVISNKNKENKMKIEKIMVNKPRYTPLVALVHFRM